MKESFILTINAGSSSLRFALFRAGGPPSRELAGKFERIGVTDSKITIMEAGAEKGVGRPFHAPNHLACAAFLGSLVKEKADVATIRAVGHCIVHGTQS
jgi:acetate kinase